MTGHHRSTYFPQYLVDFKLIRILACFYGAGGILAARHDLKTGLADALRCCLSTSYAANAMGASKRH